MALTGQVDIREAPAHETLNALLQQPDQLNTFDFVFIGEHLFPPLQTRFCCLHWHSCLLLALCSKQHALITSQSIIAQYSMELLLLLATAVDQEVQ